VLEGLAKGARRAPVPAALAATVGHALDDSQLAAHTADHEHTPSGTTVVHNGLASVDPLDALLPGAGAGDALQRP
jgi:hypothetical protein